MSAIPGAHAGSARFAVTVALPRVSTSVAIATGAVASLAPSLLPRTPVAQGVFTGILVALCWGVAALLRRPRPAGGSHTHDAARAGAAVLAGLILALSVASADHWQNALRSAMSLPAIGPGHWAQVAFWAVAVCLVLFGLTRGCVTLARRLGWVRCVGLLVAIVPLASLIAVPRAASAAAQHFRTTSSVIDTSLVANEQNSIVPWKTLGAEGRRFVAGVSDPRAVRTYVGLDSAPDVAARAALAVDELDRTGAFSRSHVVVAVPTGSGWIDGEAARGIERRFAGDVATVGMQYSYAPSWATFLFGRADAEESARTLFAAVSTRIAELPADARPALHVYGQSLGSVGGSAIFDDADDQRARACSVLWAGPPAGAVRTDGATVLANSSDPVVWWSPSLLTRAPDLGDVRVDAPVPQWIPGISFLQTGVDMLFALDAPTGHGHRYGADQGLRMPDCA